MQSKANFFSFAALVVAVLLPGLPTKAQGDELGSGFDRVARPLVAAHCLSCHSTKQQKAGLDLERFANVEQVRKDLHTWQDALEQLESGEMPPAEGKHKPLQPDDRRRLVTWIRGQIDAEIRSKRGDPGPAMVRRLSNAEYDNTIRDLTGVDLRPTKEFPAEGSGGEGFHNASEALELSPELMAKYLAAAKQVAAHVVLLPDGFRFSTSTFQNDWVDESLHELRAFHARWTDERGGIPIERYLGALVEHRAALATGADTFATLAAREQLSEKYLASLWGMLQGDTSPNVFLLQIRSQWKRATPDDVADLATRIEPWQSTLWTTYLGGVAPAGGQRLGDRQVPAMPTLVAETQQFKLESFSFKPPEAVFYLAVKAFSKQDKTLVRWERPRFEAPGEPPLSLRDALLMADGAGKDEPTDAGITPLAVDRFGRHPAEGELDELSLVTQGSQVLEVRLPAALIGREDPKLGGALNGRTFVVDVRLDPASSPAAIAGINARPRVVRDVTITAPTATDGGAVLFREANGVADAQLQKSADEFRRMFPAFACFHQIIPTDGAVTLERFHREDEPLVRLLLNDTERRKLDQLWGELNFVSRAPIQVLESFSTLTTGEIGEYEQMRKSIETDAAMLREQLSAAEPMHVQAAIDFASRAYRRQLDETEQSTLRDLYKKLRDEKVPHEEAMRGLLARVLVSPAFLFRLEQPARGTLPQPISDWELATRLSYFLWASLPDDALRVVAAEGKLREPKQLEEQARRMLKDPRVRGLAVEFGAQWLEVRGFDEFQGRDEMLFPAFNAPIRAAMYEESVLLLQDFFAADRPLWHLIDADYTFLNELLATYYGIPGVEGSQWRRVEGVRQFGRGGVLGLASVLVKHSGASRTSPVLRGNWVAEMLLGDKLPRPPADVPKLPETEDASGLTVRQMVENHVRAKQCAICHQRIDPLGFALENFDTIGRWRDKDAGGRPIDAKAKARGGAEFEGVDGLRDHLLSERKRDFQKQFCKKLLGYALGRGLLLTDQALLDEMSAALDRSDGRVSAAIMTVVASPQFRLLRGADAVIDE